MGAEQLRLKMLRETGLPDDWPWYVALTAAEAQEATGADFSVGEGVGIVYPDADGTPTGVHRVRRCSDEEPRYVQPKGSGNRLYMPRHSFSWSGIARAPEQEVAITEGEKKADAVSALGVPCLGIGGVDSWSEKGSRGMRPLPELAALLDAPRRVTLIYDSDYHTNRNVRGAADRLGAALHALGADVRVAVVPEDGADKAGVDDYLRGFPAKGRKAALRALLDGATQHRLVFPRRFETVEAAVEEMNAHAGMLDNGKVIYRRAGATHFSSPVPATSFGRLAPRIEYAYVKRTKKEERVEFADVVTEWLRHPNARQVDREICARRVAPGFSEHFNIKYANTYAPPPDAAPLTDGEFERYVRPWVDMLELQLGKADARKLLAILAMHLQGSRPLYAVVLAGRGGDGKGLLSAALHRVFEWRPGYSNILNTKSATEPRFFEAGCHGRQLVRVEEVADRKVFEILKTQMDRESAKEAKGKDSAVSFNDALVVLTTNKPKCIPLEQESGLRRWATFEFKHSLSAEERFGPVVDALDALLDSEEATGALRAYLQHFRWRGVVDRKRAPDTECRDLIRDEGRSDLELVLDELLASPPGGEQTQIWEVFTAREARDALNQRGLFAGLKAPLSVSFVAELLSQRRGPLLTRVREGKLCKLDPRDRFWARGEDAEKLAAAPTSDLKLRRPKK